MLIETGKCGILSYLDHNHCLRFRPPLLVFCARARTRSRDRVSCRRHFRRLSDNRNVDAVQKRENNLSDVCHNQ